MPTNIIRTCLILAATIMAMPIHKSQAENIHVWLGTGKSPQSKGIYHCTLDTNNGKLSDPRLVAEMEGPGFLAKHPKLPILYAVGAINNEQVVAAFAIEAGKSAPELKLLNFLAIGDGGAAHVSVDRTGAMLMTAQYGAGSVAAFSLRPDGSLKERTQLIKHSGGSRVVANRQDAPHAHWTGFSPDNQFAFVPDLGIDRVMIYKVRAESAKLEQHGEGVVPPGSGPRHMKFHPNGKWIYVLNELSLTVTVFDYDAAAGTMHPKQTIATVDSQELEKEKAKSASEVRVHPNGKFIYSANRGHDTITAFSVNESDGKLHVIQVANARAVTPRNFNVTPDGKWLLSAGQASHTLAAFSLNPGTGLLVFNQNCVYAPSCICVLLDGDH
jgi:6-phosphogluconolactonase